MFEGNEGLQNERMAGLGLPPSPQKHFETRADISVYGMSLQGSSHIERGQPCQDYSDFRFISENGLLIGAISDGVGSCALSHWGSYTVVSTVLDVMEEELEKKLHVQRFKELEGKTVGDILRKAFTRSKEAVEELADRTRQPVPNFYSTLTAVIYDGSMLYYGHIGDDGIVVQYENGMYQLITTRHKGEEANSVNPLQAGSADHLWQFGRVSEPVVGFLMSTDGVLDKYVANQSRNNRVFYPFLENALYCLEDQEKKSRERIAEEAFEYMKENLSRPEYRSQVTDDITVLAAVNIKKLREAVHPAFSMEDWKEEEEKHRREIRAKLYTGKSVNPKRNENVEKREKEERRIEKRRTEKREKEEWGEVCWTEQKKENEDEIYVKRVFRAVVQKLPLWEPVEEPKWCYCPRCKREYKIKSKESPYRYCPNCGEETKPLSKEQYW